MKENKKYLFFFLAIIVVLVVAFVLSRPKSSDVENELKKANYCGVAEDCAKIGNKCPFGCNIYVNKNEETRIKNLVDSYGATCVYECFQEIGVECVNNICKAILKQ